MDVHETFTGNKAQDEAAAMLTALLGTNEKIKKVDMRSHKGGVKLIFRTQEKDESATND